MQKHEDNRRLLISWGDFMHGEAKTLIALDDCVLGNHYHKEKTESFMLVHGKGILNGIEMKLNEEYLIEPLVKHYFELKKGSILIGLCSKKYNPNDDYEA